MPGQMARTAAWPAAAPLQRCVDAALRQRATALDAGGGRVPGLDLSAAGRVVREANRVPGERFEVILSRPRGADAKAVIAALRDLGEALRPGGLLLVEVPAVHAARMWPVKASPLWMQRGVFHVLHPRTSMSADGDGAYGRLTSVIAWARQAGYRVAEIVVQQRADEEPPTLGGRTLGVMKSFPTVRTLFHVAERRGWDVVVVLRAPLRDDSRA
jgi:hypothetical protein